MSTPNLTHWPKHAPQHLELPDTSLWYNIEVAAARYPRKAAIVFYDTILSYSQLRRSAEHLAGFLQQRCGIRRGDRVALFLHNSPQFIIGFYAILRAEAMVVPVNSMSTASELTHIMTDCGARILITAQELLVHTKSLGTLLQHTVVACYSDYLTAATDLAVPDFLQAPALSTASATTTPWTEVLALQLEPEPHIGTADDLCVMPYTSGTTGKPKGCIHRHRSVMHTAVALSRWHDKYSEEVVLAVLPLFHVTGMQNSMNTSLYVGATIVLLPRWDRDVAAKLIGRYRVSCWTTVPTIIVDLLSSPNLPQYDLSSLKSVGGGGAAMPKAIAQKLETLCGLTYIEGYGLSETMAPSHINPPDRPKPQCLGLPIFDTDSRIVDPQTLVELEPGAVGEIVTMGPQVFDGYWHRDDANAECFFDLNGKRFFRTGDLGYIDADGYFFFVDRLKRMINAAGFKVWPAEVEAQLYAHPAIQEVAVIAKPDERRGETVKAVVVLRTEARGKITPEQLTEWARANMAAYKVPRFWEFVAALPKSASGKILWRVLQEQERTPARRDAT
ncbi:MAG: long-chain fatty acid--CoA ligase [Proteobacteria bacterium]|nr:long-chain fatty acid--CoA ligase [Pseudomonadota bacterium]